MTGSPDGWGNITTKLVLPDPVDPPDSVCYTIRVPNSKYHIMAFKGAINDLALWWNWQRDDAHTARAAAYVWRKIFMSLKQESCDQPTSISVGADGGGEEMIRQNPANPCQLQSSVDGQTWCTFADFSKCMNFGTQPGGGSPQPQPGGGVSNYCAVLNANGLLLLPTVVNTGDVITIQSTDGAGWDGTELILFGPHYRCLDGGTFFAGQCGGGAVLNGGDPVPTSNHMSLIVRIGSTYYAFTGPSFTVPGGIANQQAFLQVNDAVLSDNAGNYNVCVDVTNNQLGTFRHQDNFALSTGLWVPSNIGGGDLASILPGEGFGSVGGVLGPNLTTCNIQATFSSRTITSFEIFYSTDSDHGVAGGRQANYNILNLYGSLNTGVGVFDTLITSTQTGVTVLSIGLGRDIAPTSTNYRITGVIVTGLGTDPL